MNAPEKRREPRAGGSQRDTDTTFTPDATLVRAGMQVPEFGTSRQRFLIAMFMIGAVPPERVVERVVADVEAEGTPCRFAP